tara:strand:+ start:273 stop:452 length:180 start_codon:yes stop_codon:yes gene_type:complete
MSRKQYFITMEGITQRVLSVEADCFSTAIREAKAEFSSLTGSDINTVAVVHMNKYQVPQ